MKSQKVWQAADTLEKYTVKLFLENYALSYGQGLDIKVLASGSLTISLERIKKYFFQKKPAEK